MFNSTPAGAFSAATSAIWRFTEAARRLPTSTKYLDYPSHSSHPTLENPFDTSLDIVAPTNRTIVRFISG